MAHLVYKRIFSFILNGSPCLQGELAALRINGSPCLQGELATLRINGSPCLQGELAAKPTEGINEIMLPSPPAAELPSKSRGAFLWINGSSYSQGKFLLLY